MAKVWGVIVLGDFHEGQLSRDQFSRGELVRGNCPGAKVRGVVALRNFMWGNCPGGKCPDTSNLESGHK